MKTFFNNLQFGMSVSIGSINDIKLNDRKLFIRFFSFVSLLYAFFALVMLAYYVIQVLL